LHWKHYEVLINYYKLPQRNKIKYKQYKHL
jgi:hypothetical protein